MKNKDRVEAWIKQAKDDVRWAMDSLKNQYFAQTCFISQQIAEKALKGLAFYRGNDLVKSHSLIKISKALGINGEILKASHKLDLYYISTRYPDALMLAKRVLELVEQEILINETGTKK